MLIMILDGIFMMNCLYKGWYIFGLARRRAITTSRGLCGDCNENEGESISCMDSEVMSPHEVDGDDAMVVQEENMETRMERGMRNKIP